jgi:nucleotide-binding universal stress UspA family protein
VISITFCGDKAHRAKPLSVSELCGKIGWSGVLLAVEKPGVVSAIKSLLFATDFSEASEAALPYVAAVAQAYACDLHLVHVLPELSLLHPGATGLSRGSVYESFRNGVQARAKRVSARLKDVPHHVHIRQGGICDQLEKLIREQEIDLLVVGTHGRTGLGRLVMGSVAEEILRSATCPVLTVGPGVLQRFDRTPFAGKHLADIRRILYATDFKQASLEALANAISFAQQFESRLALLHVIEDYGEHLEETPGPTEAAMAKLRELVPDDAVLPHPPEFLAQFGAAAESILQTAVEREADLMVLGARPVNRRATVASHFSRTIAHKVIVGAHCPVLTVHA